MIDLNPIKTRLDRTLSELYEAADNGDSVSLSLAEVEVMADDVRALVAEVERLRSRFSMANAKPLKFVAAPGEFEEDGA